MLHRSSSWSRALCPSFLAVAWALALSGAAVAQLVKAEHKISATAGGFGGPRDQQSRFGWSVAALGDLNGDGVGDLAVGVPFDDDGDADQGAVGILFLNPDGTVASEQRISETQGGFGGTLQNGELFGSAVAALGDLNGDGVVDLAVGCADYTLHGDLFTGRVWILFLNPDGTVASEQEIGENRGGFVGDLDADDRFGSSLAGLGDLNGDGTVDLAVGAPRDDDVLPDQGAVWILFLKPDGTVASEQRISASEGGFGGALDEDDEFGSSLASLGDLDGNGVRDLAVGVPFDVDGGGLGAIWILFMNSDGTVASEQKISNTQGGLGGVVAPADLFGISVANMGDLDGDGIGDLAVGSTGDDDGGPEFGAVWILFLKADGTVRDKQKISATQGGFGGHLTHMDFFGVSATNLGDVDGDGIGDLAVGASEDDIASGAVWILFLNNLEPCVTLDFDTEDDLATVLVNGQHIDTEFGTRVTITSSGPNAGAAIFDSTPLGPNQTSPDEDLLIHHGNLLLLQDSAHANQSVPGFFDLPLDDPDGGDLVFTFHSPVEPRSVVLIDLDPPPNEGASVTLFDAADRARVYTVPPGWTGTYGVPGFRTLDLTTLDPQIGNAPGFRVATASEMPGFLASRVLKIDVHLTGLGAVDDLSWCSPGSTQAHASASVRNGSGVNPLALSNLTTPVLGGIWSAQVDCSGHASGFASLNVKSLPVTLPTSHGELLVRGQVYLRLARPHLGSQVSFALPVPNDLALIGLTARAQGLCTGNPRTQLTNAVDVVLGF